MNTKFIYTIEKSIIGTDESAICGIEIDGRKVPFTGAGAEIENFGIPAEEMAVFATEADSIHFEHKMVYVPVRGTTINDKTSTEEIAVLTVRAIADGEVIKTAQISRVVCSW